MTKKEKLTAFFYSEGGQDRKFLELLVTGLEVFHARKWSFNFDNASGGSADYILEKCRQVSEGISYDVIICFVDLDRLKRES